MLVQRCDHVANQFVDLSDVVASARANAEVSDDRASGRHDDQVLTHSAAREERVARRMRHVPGHSSFADIAVDDVGPEAGTIASVEGLRSRTRLAHLPFRQDAPIANDAVVNIEPAEAHPIAG